LAPNEIGVGARYYYRMPLSRSFPIHSSSFAIKLSSIRNPLQANVQGNGLAGSVRSPL
jgi:hypothetical protein